MVAQLLLLSTLAIPQQPGNRTSAARDGFFDSNGVRIHYLVQGSGEPVLLIHGQGNSTQIWSAAGILDMLAQDHQVIAFDLRGHPSSSPRCVNFLPRVTA